MNIGDYVRNKYGIAKIIDIKTNDEGIDICYFDNAIAFIFDTKLKEEKYRTHILPLANNVDTNKIKHSPNIIDLIEVGDYVNGNKIIRISEDFVGRKILIYGYDDEERQVAITIYEDEIKSIITKEMFANAEYRVESN